MQIWLKFANFLGEISPNFRYHKIDWKKKPWSGCKNSPQIWGWDEGHFTDNFNVCGSEAVFLDENEILDGWFNGGNWEVLGTKPWKEDRSLHGWDSLYTDELLACLDGCPFSLNPNSSRACAGAPLRRHRETERARAREREREKESERACVFLCVDAR